MSDSHAAPPAYVHFSFSSRETLDGDARQVGELLVRECLQRINKGGREFAPKLWVLWATSAWAPFKELLEGIRSVTRELGDAPLLGASVRACVFNKQVYPEGVVLWCLASPARQPNLTAHLAMAPDAREDPKAAVDGLLEQLGLTKTLKNPRGNRMLLAFIPGFADGGSFDSYNATEIHRELRRQTSAVVPIFGGVSAMLADGKQGVQFYYDTVVHDGIVAALIETDLRFALGMAHGLTTTDKVWHVAEPGGTTREVRRFTEGTPTELLKSEPTPYLFGLNCLEHNEAIAYEPQLLDTGILKLLKPIPPKAALTLLKPDPEKMAEAAVQAAEWAMQRVGITQDRIIAGIGIACTARFVWGREIGHSATRAMELVSGRFPLAAVVGCYMDGEMGLDETGRSVIGNWSVSMMAVSDELSPRAQLYRGFTAFSERGPQSAAAQSAAPQSVEAVLSSILDLVERAGFPGGMVSLCLRNSNDEWLAPCQTRGSQWGDVGRQLILDGNGDSLTASVARADTMMFVPDLPLSENASERERQVFRQAGIVSVCIMPLISNEELLGMLHIDLADMRKAGHETPEQRLVLEGIARYAAATIREGFHIQELSFAKQIDAEYDRALSRESVGGAFDAAIDSALQPVLDAARDAIDGQGNVDIIYARVVEEADRTKLRMSAGCGAYWEAARNSSRRVIDVNKDPSPGTIAFEKGGEWLNVVNDTEMDPHVAGLCKRYDGTVVGEALKRYRSYANIAFLGPVWAKKNDVSVPPTKEPLGILTIGSTKRNWLLHAGHCACLRVLAERVGLLVHYVRYREELRRVSDTLGYMNVFGPGVPIKRTLGKVLANHLDNIRKQYDSVVSCYLWEGERKRFILRAQSGWKEDGWLGSANYLGGEGMTGTAANDLNAQPEVCSDVQTRRRQLNLPAQAGKYAVQMFGKHLDPEKENCELIILPLKITPPRWKRSLGVVTVHRVRAKNEEQASFANLDAEVLAKACSYLNMILLAHRAVIFECWQRQEGKRLSEVAAALTGDIPEQKLLQRACDQIRSVYGTLCCAVFLVNEKRDQLRPIASSGTLPPDFPPSERGTDVVSKSCWERDGRLKPKYGEERIPKPPPESQSPDEWAKWNLVSAVCLPLVENEPVGVLYVKWGRKSPYSGTENKPVRHDRKSLRRLAGKVSEALLRNRATRNNRDLLAAWAGVHHHVSTDVGNLLEAIIRITEEKPAMAAYLSEVVRKGRELQQLLWNKSEFADSLLNPEIATLDVSEFVRVLVKDRLPKFQETRKIWCFADKKLLKLVLSNVLDNASDAMKDTEKGEVTIEIGTDYDARIAKVIVTDNGPGMTVEQIKEAFLGKYTTKVEGMHIGLMLSRMAMDNQNGSLTLDPREERSGIVATLTLPLSHPEKPHE